MAKEARKFNEAVSIKVTISMDMFQKIAHSVRMTELCYGDASMAHTTAWHKILDALVAQQEEITL